MLYNLTDAISGWLADVGLYPVIQIMFRLEFRAFLSVVLSFLFVVIFGKRVIRWLLKQKIGDAPEFYHADLNALMANKSATPTMGGILICGSLLATILLLADLTNPYVHIALVVLIWLAVLGGADDWLKLTSSRRLPGSREGLYAWEKLLFQLGIGAAAGWFLYQNGDQMGHILNLPFQRTYAESLEIETTALPISSHVLFLGPLVFVLISTILVAGTSNAVNLTDGMDGLAGGALVVASFALMVLCFIAGTLTTAKFLLFPYVAGAKEMMVITGAMAGSCLGFLWFNCQPAQVFMGDTGSLPLGGLMAYIAVAIRQEILFLLIGGVFFMEMASVIAQVAYFKWTKGKRIFRCSPIHHHFHLGGWSEQQVVIRFWLLGVIFAMIALVSLKMR